MSNSVTDLCVYSNQCEFKTANCEIYCIDYTPDKPFNPDDCNFMSQDCEFCDFLNYCITKKF